ncbi:hypothetical protein PRIPAC_96952 [Pristionchus pacificus]|uniref:Uncharacterized protein n=1 Tax=Pristionchus pacificus TaxID=54126 RepID=A0A454XL81_PRIPA|nr:hypothetical protein PRIPAC_96952 [Pristionchus pacificus]|eukprot:PDM81795.1 hypothetical protein PRIPAC_33949 [Pristionchus pacificus]
MAIRTLLTLLALALAALAQMPEEYVLDPKRVVELYDEQGPLKCYVTNTVTNEVELKVCQVPGQPLSAINLRDFLLDEKTTRPIAGYPACMAILFKGAFRYSCVPLPGVATTSCDRECIETAVSPLYTSCCCTTSECNKKMISRKAYELEELLRTL